MCESSPNRSSLVFPLLTINGLLAVSYFGLAMLGLSFPMADPNVTLLWLPTGLSLGALYRLGFRYAPGLLLGALAVNMQFNTPVYVVCTSLGNILAPVVAVLLLRDFRWCADFARLRDVLVFLCVSAVSATISAGNGTLWAAVSANMTTGQIQNCFLNWWLGDSLGFLLAGIPILTFRRHLADWWKLSLALILCIAITIGITLTPLISHAAEYPILLISTTLVVGIVIRFGIWAGSIAVMMVSTVMVLSELGGVGPQMLPPTNHRAISVWSHLVVIETMLMLLTALATERNRVRKTLDHKQAEHQTLMEDNPAMIVRFNRANRLTYGNIAFCEFKKMSYQELVGRYIFDLMHKESIEGVRQTMVECVRTGQSARYEGPFLGSGESTRWVRWSLRTVKLPDSDDYEFQAVGIDITQTYLERQEQRALDEQMLHTQRLESLGVLAGGIAHDFNNLLVGVLGHAELGMEITSGDVELQSHFKPILEGARRCADLTRQLMAYAGKGKLSFELIQLNHVLRETVDLVRVSVPKLVELVLDIDRPLTNIEADETQIRQVLMNLIINAGEAIGDKPGKITVRTDEVLISESDFSRTTASFLRGGKYVRLLVSDDGSGMDESTQARIFDPFFTTKFAGRGLGLASVMGIVKAHGGTIHVESDQGHGTTFTVLLPVALSSEVLKAQSSLSETKTHDLPGTDEFSPQQIKRPVALLAVFDPKTSEQTQPMLAELGWDVVVVHDEDSARRRLEADPKVWSLLIWDSQLMSPSAKAILTERRDVPLLLLANSAAGIDEQLLAIPPESVLLRPFRFQDLQQKIHQLHTPSAVG
jgi:two-component system, cell cycle sensor histidine kinase and response regulator CckA